ncbi:hypothetical protein ACIRJL_10210 [Streptomyces sp. NPDC102383]|uniref:hypothetical protein n=1 Tax=unclassified Streptomyces TaxID=2593676 RepID=UPI00381E8368
MDIEQAQARHDAGEPYAVAAVPAGSMQADRVVEVALRSNFVRVYFYDEAGRVVAAYRFRGSDGQLFLGEITSWEYDDVDEYQGMNESLRIESDEYNEDGTGIRTVRDKVAGESYQQELSLKPGETFDDRYEPAPRFGDYASIARGERSQPPIPFG